VWLLSSLLNAGFRMLLLLIHFASSGGVTVWSTNMFQQSTYAEQRHCTFNGDDDCWIAIASVLYSVDRQSSWNWPHDCMLIFLATKCVTSSNHHHRRLTEHKNCSPQLCVFTLRSVANSVGVLEQFVFTGRMPVLMPNLASVQGWEIKYCNNLKPW